MYSHWFGKSEWVLIPEKHYRKLQEVFADKGYFPRPYEELVKGKADAFAVRIVNLCRFLQKKNEMII